MIFLDTNINQKFAKFTKTYCKISCGQQTLKAIEIYRYYKINFFELKRQDAIEKEAIEKCLLYFLHSAFKNVKTILWKFNN